MLFRLLGVLQSCTQPRTNSTRGDDGRYEYGYGQPGPLPATESTCSCPCPTPSTDTANTGYAYHVSHALGPARPQPGTVILLLAMAADGTYVWTPRVILRPPEVSPPP
ncbi:hypothetical protein GMORB2_1942 [Geosmithia morbida]|uniref:Uncharacterized protein n=1 Tax=Geosmithia morbida TaxID=1094350 RepID=A0A9P5D4I5_9HYPO|nr:uncharacterized protein GMORB2_1942 [Geosmithia morbida]KAF4121534.1 hypothetical protein GMORB2_1942 [Geosmithia morbida]